MSRDSEDEDPHDRTRRLGYTLGAPRDLVGLQHRRVVLEIDAATADTVQGRLAFLTITNLAARLGPYVPSIDLVVPGDAARLASDIYGTGTNLAEQALWIALNASSPTGFVRQLAPERAAYDLAVTIGTPTVSAVSRFFVGWSGSLGVVSDAPFATSGTSIFGPLVASALAVARLHAGQLRNAGATSIPTPRAHVALDAFSLHSAASLVDDRSYVKLPSTLVVGAGALGSSFAYALTHLPGLTGGIDVVDHDYLKPANSNRQITAPFSSAASHMAKVDDLARALRIVRPNQLRYEDFKTATSRSAGDYEIAVTALDSTDVRRAVATDLPRVVLDGATGGLTVSLMRGADPKESCLPCEYPAIETDAVGEWSALLGLPRATVERLMANEERFSSEIVSTVRATGRVDIDSYDLDLLQTEGWKYLVQARCGNARPDRDLPTASVSYLSALCGFLMAAQYLAEVAGDPALTHGRPCWTWDDVLRCEPPQERQVGGRSAACVARHELRSGIYRRRWQR